MTINEREINFSISNKKHARNFEAALKQMGEEEKRIKSQNQEDLSALLDSILEMFRNFFVRATGEDVVGDCEDANEAKDMYEEFLVRIKKQEDKFLSPYDLNRVK